MMGKGKTTARLPHEADGTPQHVSNGNGELTLNSQSLEFVEGLLNDYLRDPESVPPEWRTYFDEMHRSEPGLKPRAAGVGQRPWSLFNPPGGDGRRVSERQELDIALIQERVDQLIRNYRVRGHRVARVDPLEHESVQIPELDPVYHGLSEADFDRTISTSMVGGSNVRTPRSIIEQLRNTYCRSIGAQFMHIDELPVRDWLQDRMEASENRITLTRDEQIRILTKLTDAVVFEEFIQKKFLGAKSFSLEGAESLIPLLYEAIEKAGADEIQEIVLGMAHRGRLNVLANIMGKSPRQIFREFEDVDPNLHAGRGDVKYHLGYSTDWHSAAGTKLHLSLCFNPSHLEFVNPVALGRMRAKQDRFDDRERRRGMVLLIHGDAAFAGEGVVQETLNLSELPGYSTGGTIHVVVNNQIGFTTSSWEGRSSVYATDVAKMLQIPIFHVNGEDPEAVTQVVRLAMDFRKKFQRDVVIDMYCYRLRGHNEGDEPSFTQPLMYERIGRSRSVRERYLNHLLDLGGITREEADRIEEERRQHLEQELQFARSDDYSYRHEMFGGIWNRYHGGEENRAEDVDTGVDQERLRSLLLKLNEVPEGFQVHRKIERLQGMRREMADGARPLDWSAAEALALATLAVEGYRVRMSGQDSERGTFSQRHAKLHDVASGQSYMALAHLSEGQAPVEIYNSPLSEAGVLGFEYGYSLDWPDGLVLWEAQFGDFANAAQVIIDQFIVSAEDKWRRLSGLVLLLPHGFEGQGPEHSSARLERFLMLAAEDNIQVVAPTTPAQYFHCLRRQVLRPWRKPMVVMTPKSLLRHPQVVSTLDDCAHGTFQRVLPADPDGSPEQFRHVLLCSGKIYYELLEKRKELGREDVAVLRMEQIYPLPAEALRSHLAAFPDGTEVCWVQEEPENMGAWRFLRTQFGEQLFHRLPFRGVCRPASASPATGSARSHKLEQDELLAKAFGGF